MDKKITGKRNILFIIGVCVALFFGGYMFGLFTASGHMTESGQENGAAQKEIPAEYRAESSEEESIQEEELIPEEKSVPEEETDALSEEDRAFLEEHIYGQWRFADRIVELDQNNNIHNGGISNISDVGVEELKRTVVICYEDDCFWCPGDIGQNTFSYAQDMYLFGMYNGFSWTKDPVYSINEMDTDKVVIWDIYKWNLRYEVRMPGWEDYVHVEYSLPRPTAVYGNGGIGLFCNDIYVDPSDTDTIYVDFCGLWKMTRDENNYSTN